MQKIIFPKPLKKGDKIAIISPAGAVQESQLSSTLELIKSKGYEPVLGKNVYSNFQNGYAYAGTDQQRLEDINWALNDKHISAIWTSRGGYGCQHLLKGIKLQGFRKYPKWLIGYSDVTVLQSFLLKKGYGSIHGQSIKTSSFGASAESYDLIFGGLQTNKLAYKIESNPNNKKGKATGLLVGGNLALIYALLGTPYHFDFRDKILFIEEVGENFYALDRMLTSLELAGVFGKIKGLVVGGMTNMGNDTDNKSYEEPYDAFAYQLIKQIVSKYDLPVAFGFPNGHIFDNRPLAIGAQAELKVDKQAVLKLNF